MPWILRAAALVSALTVALTMVAVPAQADPGNNSESADLSGVESLADRMVPAQLDDGDIPGAVVTVVADGKTLFSKGYGTADLDSDTPMKADTTGFYTASEAKLFTATAALQLVRQNKLDLHTDVNRYLDDLTIPDTYPGQPVTLHHLLTYTSGFDYDIYGWSQWQYDQMPALAEFAATVQPPRVRPPGEQTAYNNYDYVLIGRLIEIASGQSYADYVTEHIFQPLGMTKTTAEQPHPQGLQKRVATDYRPDGDSQTETAGQMSPSTPAGGDTVTDAPDLARFMIAQLQQDKKLGAGVARSMQQEESAADPRIPGMGYAFEQRPRNGHRVLFKDGDLPGLHHSLALVPGSDIGIHVVYNGDGTNGAAFWGGKELINKIIDTSLGTSKAARPEPHPSDVSGYAGSYADAGTSQTTFAAVTGLTAGITVEVDGPGRLITTGLSEDPSAASQHWLQIKPGLFRQENGTATIAFREDGTLVSSQTPAHSYPKLAWYAAPMLHLMVLAGAALVLLVTFVFLPVRAAVRRRRRGTPTTGSRFALVLGWLTSACVVLFGGAFAIISSDPNKLMQIPFTGDLTLSIALNTMTAMGVATIGVAVAAVLAWLRRWWSPLARTAYSLVALASIAFVTIAINYRLIGPPFTLPV